MLPVSPNCCCPPSHVLLEQAHLLCPPLSEAACRKGSVGAGASSSQCPLPQGRLKAKVVAADSIRASDTLKEVVVYKIRAADAQGEWTVSRRYSNFEQLHRQLRDVSTVTPHASCTTAQTRVSSSACLVV